MGLRGWTWCWTRWHTLLGMSTRPRDSILMTYISQPCGRGSRGAAISVTMGRVWQGTTELSGCSRCLARDVTFLYGTTYRPQSSPFPMERVCQNRILSGYFHFQVCCELLWTSAPLTLLMGGSRAGRLHTTLYDSTLWGKRGGRETKMSVALVGDEVPLVGTAPTEARPSVAR